MKYKSLAILVAVVILVGAVWFFKNPAQAPAPGSSTSPTPTRTASPSVSPTNSPSVPRITITSPKANEQVDMPITVKGYARGVFENQLTVRVKDATGKVIYETPAMTDSSGGDWVGNYSVKFSLPAGTSQKITIEALEFSAKDGTPINVVKAPVTIKNISTVNRYVALQTSDDCTTVKLFPRPTLYTKEVIFSALSELLRGGTTDEEKAAGAFNSVPKGGAINSIRQTGDTVYVDFNFIVESGGGSCSMSGRRAQIDATVKQFLGVNNVVVSIDGRTKDIFQP
ncbi:GerMN domain-containing protein [Candidatus Parcubacteria bacterium]|nr:GerMN domain-containing protein [Candidatus Parcubacteria bacterium]